jgi:formate-dependent nitrite reductase membrane component NrfD
MTTARYEQLLADLAAEYRPQREWAEGRGVFLIVGHFLVGIAGGAWVYGQVFAVPACLLVAYALGALGGLAHLFNLARPERFWRMALKVKTSWIARGFWGLGLFMLGGALALPPLLLPNVAWPALLAQLGTGLGWIGAAIMICYMGFVYTASKGIPFWNSPLHPVLYIAYALRGGAAALLTLVALLGLAIDPAAGLLQSWLAVTAVVIVLWGFDIGFILSGGEQAARRSVHELLRGRLALSVYGGILLVGLLVPLVLISGIALPQTPATLAAMGLASICGDFFMKWSSVKAGVHLPISLARA